MQLLNAHPPKTTLIPFYPLMIGDDTSMKYQYTAIYYIKGIDLPKAESDKEIILDSCAGFRAILTREPDAYRFESDRLIAITSLMDAIIEQFKPKPEVFKKYFVAQDLADTLKKVKENQEQSFPPGLYLVLIKEGITDDISQHISSYKYQIELDEFVAYYDKMDAEDFNADTDPYTLISEEIKAVSKPYVSAALFALLTPYIIEIEDIKKAIEFVAFFRKDQKPIYFCKVLTSLEVSLIFTTNSLESIQNWYEAVIVDDSLKRVRQLLLSSLEPGDTFRSFLSVWTSLEIFLNKLEKGDSSVLYKFESIAPSLCPNDADKDISIFKIALRKRNDLVHRQDFVETELLVREVQKLVQKYLLLYLIKNK